MHKQEASQLFGVLSHEDRVKICKMLYVNGSLTEEDLKNRIGVDDATFFNHIALLKENDMVTSENGMYSVNKELIDTLMSFIQTPCGCTH